MAELSDKVAYVPGGTGGIGQAVALGLAALGARVVVGGTESGKVERLVESLRAAGHEARGVAFDARSVADIKRSVDAVCDYFGRCDVLVNCAGIHREGSMLEMSEELFDDGGVLVSELAGLPPRGERRMSANPHANGGLLLRDLHLPDFRDYAVPVEKPGTTTSEATRVLGAFLRDVVSANAETFRLFGPDETASNRLADVFEVTDRAWNAALEPFLLNQPTASRRG